MPFSTTPLVIITVRDLPVLKDQQVRMYQELGATRTGLR